MPFSDDELIEQIAAQQRGLVTRVQLLAGGITTHAIASRVRANRLRMVHRGVYRVGPVMAPHARELAAVLACGPHAVLSHSSAGWVWQVLPDPGAAGPVDVSLRQGDRGRRPQIRVHRICLPTNDITSRDNIPITTPGRTLVDLAAVLTSRELELVLARMERLNLLERRELLSLTARHAGRPGAPLLRALVENEGAPALTRSEAEERFLGLIRKSQLPQPESNVQIGEYEVDFFWRKFENDRRRDARLAARGVSVMRVTWRQMRSEPEAMLVPLAQTLTRAGTGRVDQPLSTVIEINDVAMRVQA